MSGLFAGSSGMQTRSKSAATAEATKADSASAHDIQMDPVNLSAGVHDSSQTIQPDTDVDLDDEAQPIDPTMEDEIKEMINEFEIYLTKKKMAKKAKKAQKKKEEDSKKGKGRKPDNDPSDSSDTEGGDKTPRNRPTNRHGRHQRTSSPLTHDMGRIPKIRPMLEGAQGFSKWVHGLKIVMMMYDVDCAVDNYTYWSVIEGDLQSWDEDTLKGYGLKLRTWNQMNGFILQTMRLNCEEGPLRLIGLAETASDAFAILKNNYENKQVADLGVALTSVTKMTFKEGTAIKNHIEDFETKWENMGNISAGHLKPELREFGKLLQYLSINELAKKELLLATFPTHIMKYSQLVQNMRIKTDYTYGDLVSNLKQYVPQLEWKKKGNGESGSKENPVVLATHQQNKGGPPKDKFGNLLDTSKQCGYCQKVKKWRGIGHTESECKTKQRERSGENQSQGQNKQGGQVKAAYEETDDFEIQSQLGGVKIGMIKIGRVKRQNAGWYEFDTGAQAHTTNEKWRLTELKPGQDITGFNGVTTTSECSGTMTMRHGGRDIILKNVQYHPKFCNLISGQKLQNFSLISDNNGTRVQTDKDDTLYHISRGINGTMWIVPEDTKIVTLRINKETLQSLHERYGHISFDTLKSLPEAKGISGPGTGTCTACLKSKSVNPSSKTSPVGQIRTTKVLERIHADLIGPLSKRWLGKKYILTIMDDFSRYCTAIPIRDKTHASEKTKEWILALENTTGNKTAFIQTDWGTEFNNLKTWGTKRGTRTKETIPYHSETHAIIERLNRTLQDMARTAMIAAGLKGLWGDAIQWAAYTKNRIPHKTLPKNQSPIEVLLNRSVERTNLRPFGQKVMAHIYKEQRESRISERAIECRIMQYTETHGIYLVINHNGKRFLTKDPRPIMKEESSDSEDEPTEQSKVPELPNKPPAAPRKSKRIEENLELGRGISNYQDLINRGLAGNRVGHDDDHPTEEQAQVSPYAHEWAIARETERAKLRQYGVYTVVTHVPEGHRPVDTKWVYDVKRDNQGNLLRRRARKVGRGFTQEAGVNYGETFSQMSRSETWRILLALTVQNNWAIRQWDVKAAYLQAPLTHEVYIQDTENGKTEYWRLNKALYGLKQAGHEWYKTMKNIMVQVGLRQLIGDPGCFHNQETRLIISTHVDDMMAIAPSENQLNDIEKAIEHHVELDKLGIPTKLLGMELTWTKDKKGKEIKLTQKTSIENLEKEHDLTVPNVPTRSLPLNPTLFEPPKGPEEELTPDQLKKYQSLVGSLLYINRCTRPEISIQVNLLGRRTSRASHNNLRAAMHVLRYLAFSKQKGVTIRRVPGGTKTSQEKGVIKAYADASYGGEQAKSQSGNLVTLNGQIIMWNSRRQDITAQSITEAEYIACSEATKDIRWLQQLLEEFPSPIQTKPAYLYSDNEAAVKLTKTQTFHKRTRHIEHRYHYIRELVEQEMIQLRGITGKDNPSDILTKILPMSSVNKWMRQQGLE